MQVKTEAQTTETPPEEPKKRGGARPNSGGARPGAGRPPNPDKAPKGEEPFILPKIPFRRGTERFEDFVKWWHELTAEQLEKLIVYAYRKWPVCDAKLVDPDGENNIEKITGPCPFSIEDWRHSILERYHSGSYCFYVKEGNVQRWTIFANDVIDLVNYPPMIDYKTLMLSVPANKDFVRWSRQRNLIPNENEDSNGMANAAVDRLVDQNDRLVTRVIDMADRMPEQRPDVDTSAQLAGMEMIQRAGERALDVAMKSADRLAEMNNNNNDPLVLVKAFTEMSSQMRGGDSKTDIMLEMMRSEREIAARREDAAREEARAERKRSDELMMMLMKRSEKPERDDDGEPRGLMGMLTQLKTMKESLTELGIVKGDSGGEAEPAGKAVKDSLIEMALRNAPVIMGGLESIAGKAMAMFAMSRGVPGAAVNPAAPTIATLTTPPPPPPEVPATPYTPFLAAITPTLLHHFEFGPEGGATFAQWLMGAGPLSTFPVPGTTGKGLYDGLKERGPDAVKQIMQIHPPIWNVVSETPAKLEGFIAEFLKADDPEPEG